LHFVDGKTIFPEEAIRKRLKGVEVKSEALVVIGGDSALASREVLNAAFR